MRFVDEDVFVKLDALRNDLFELADGHALVSWDAEVAEDTRPGSGAVFIEQARRRDDEAATIELQREQRGDVSLSQTNHVREEDASIGLEHLLRSEDSIFLVT